MFRAFKILLAIFGLFFVALILWLWFERPGDKTGWMIAMLLLLGVAALCFDHSKPLPPVFCAFILILLSVGFTHAFITGSDVGNFPKNCSGKGRLFCDLENLENLLYELGGMKAVVMPYLLAVGGMLYALCRDFWKSRQSKSD